jgi:eukaryotic-like serine/threonine-protein kinase
MSTNLRQIDKYILQERLGLGGMAEVWKAKDTQLQRYVAIKFLHADLQNDPNFVTRFEREAQLIAALHHPNIIQIYDFRVSRPPETNDTLAYMVMDYVEGQTLAQYLRNTSHQGRFPSYPTLLQLFAPICLAVDYAHQKGMIHRDIKPSNILLDRRNTAQNPMGEPILSDFGIARLLSTSNTMQSGWHLGTPSYISPEQVMGSPGSERSDIYALSVILYEACTGTLPFRGDNPGSVMMLHVNTTPIAPALINPHIPPALAATILCGLAKNPAERFPTASALCVALSEAMNIPLPDNVKSIVYQTAEMDNPTYIRPVSSSNPQILPAGTAISTSTPAHNTPLVDSVQTPSLGLLANQAFPSQPSSASLHGLTPQSAPAPQPSSASLHGISSQTVPALQPSSASLHGLIPQPALTSQPSSASLHGISPQLVPTQSAQGSTPPTPPRFNKRILARVLIALALVVASLSAILLFTLHKSTPTPVVTGPAFIGHVFFLNSEQLDPNNSQGINDEVLLDLQNVPDPPAGQAYYAWLLGDKLLSEQVFTPLGRLNIDHGRVHLFYPGNQSHTNLLATDSRILITKEDATLNPTMYTPDTKAWAYYAQLSQSPSPKDKLHFSMLDHLRHLLSESPELKIRGLHGGLDMWLLRNTQKLLEWSNAARDEQNNSDLLHRQIVRVLDYIDGSSFVQKDAPAVGSVLLVDPHDDQVALLGPPPDGQDPPGYSFDDEVPPGYVYLIGSHMAGAVLSPDATQDQRDLAAQIHLAIDQDKKWLEQIHQDAKQLVTMNANQLAQPQTLLLLDDMVTQAEHAYNGVTDPSTGQQQGGAVWICGNIQRMANFDLQLYKAS